jgi:hypothetical protein
MVLVDVTSTHAFALRALTYLLALFVFTLLAKVELTTLYWYALRRCLGGVSTSTVSEPFLALYILAVHGDCFGKWLAYLTLLARCLARTLRCHLGGLFLSDLA